MAHNEGAEEDDGGNGEGLVKCEQEHKESDKEKDKGAVYHHGACRSRSEEDMVFGEALVSVFAKTTSCSQRLGRGRVAGGQSKGFVPVEPGLALQGHDTGAKAKNEGTEEAYVYGNGGDAGAIGL